MLLAGPAGRLIRIENRKGFEKRSGGHIQLLLRFDDNVRSCAEPAADAAFCIAFGWLDEEDDGDPTKTLIRLWYRANRLLHKPANQNRLKRLAERLIEENELSGDQVVETLAAT